MKANTCNHLRFHSQFDITSFTRKTKKIFKKGYDFGDITTWAGLASFIAMVLGGILYGYIGVNIMWIEALFAAFAVFAFLFLPELLEVRRVVKHKQALQDVVSITTNTLKNPKLRNLILFPSVFGAFTIILFWILQPIMETQNIPVGLFGYYLGANQISVTILSKFAYKICEKLGEIQTSLITIGTVIFGTIMGFLAMHVQSMPIIYVACAFMAIASSVHTLNHLQYNTLIHHSNKSNERGTVLSTRAMVSTAIGAVGLITAKFLLDIFGITTTLVFTLVMTGLLMWSLQSVKKYIK